jgi:hypothetical protein
MIAAFLVLILPTAVLYLTVVTLGILFVRSKSLFLLVALLIAASPLWLFWPWAYMRSDAELKAWQKQIFFPDQPIAGISELTIAGDRMDSCRDPCAELLLNNRLPKITLWSKAALNGPSKIQAVTANITAECKALIARNGFYNASGREKIEKECFSYRPVEIVPDGYVLFVGESLFFEIEPRRDPSFGIASWFRYQAFRKDEAQLEEIAYSAKVRTDRLVFPPLLSPLRLGFERGPAFDFGEEQGAIKLLNRIFAFDLTGDVKL